MVQAIITKYSHLYSLLLAEIIVILSLKIMLCNKFSIMLRGEGISIIIYHNKILIIHVKLGASTMFVVVVVFSFLFLMGLQKFL